MDNKNTATQQASARQLIADIKAATGLSEAQIAKRLGISQPTVNRIVNGQGDCKTSTWMAITVLHQQVCLRPAPGNH
ncbi:helix-turn-helix domain-containing protein [Undibacterium terreum]|uniref:Helix-turn-helix n=1 Tax=Undibacterium terreum TaxID=1224302 RepID=A0A916U9T1_9BURK|nr:helix-turn-helix transcriptional regulator [Undibacterium terreum]GGC65588.1 hypothetical protein GCM10011396_10750 [Undibacterium terreum]